MPDCSLCGTNGAQLVESTFDSDDLVCVDAAACHDRMSSGFYLEHRRVTIAGDSAVWIVDGIGGADDLSGPDMAELHAEHGRRFRRTVPVRDLSPVF